MKLIKKEISKGKQDCNYEEILSMNDYKIRVSIKSDAYSFQNYARVFVFKDLAWSQIDNIHYSQMKTKSELAYVSNVTENDFKMDRDALIKTAKKVLE
jgi:hydrogenase maturation factor